MILYGWIHILVLFMQSCFLVLLCLLDPFSYIQIQSMWLSPQCLSLPICTKSKGNFLFKYICHWEIRLSVRGKINRWDILGAIEHKTSSETAPLYKIMCSSSEYLRLSFFTVWMLYYFLFSPNSPILFNSRQTQGALNESDDPETGCLSDNKPTSRHFYPVALLLVSSHLLVVWLILSLALLLAKYQ